MRKSMLVPAFLAALFASAAAGSQDSEATKIIQRYLKMPMPRKPPGSGPERKARLKVLSELKSMPAEAVSAYRRAMREVKNPWQRYELAVKFRSTCSAFDTDESVALLCELLTDHDEKIRCEAIRGLHGMARRTERIGGKRIQRKRDFAPKVGGLVPYLISAASDKVDSNRIVALYALADTREPLAVSELRKKLKDPSELVRSLAACLLTEYQDATGLPEMRNALDRLRSINLPLALDMLYYDEAEMLLASFERITGKSFGRIPPNPSRIPLNPNLCSDTRQIQKQNIKKRYNTLLDTWAEWWAWEPKAEEK
jgi:HEAT repeat protein